MIYTIGNLDSYRKGLSDPRGLKKLGSSQEYLGGAVWKTPEEAKEHLENNQPRLEGYGVFEIDASWEYDVIEHPENMPWHLLVNTSPITREMEI